jgi:hypothetical protein
MAENPARITILPQNSSRLHHRLRRFFEALKFCAEGAQ